MSLEEGDQSSPVLPKDPDWGGSVSSDFQVIVSTCTTQAGTIADMNVMFCFLCTCNKTCNPKVTNDICIFMSVY